MSAFSTVRSSESINSIKLKNALKPRGNKFYTYLILDANLLYKLIKRFDTNGLCNLIPKEITMEDQDLFRKLILYIGKGCNDRKFMHLIEALAVLDGKMPLKKISAKLSKIAGIWETENGVVLLQIFNDSDHYISLCRENAMIKAVGNTLTNILNGSIYGLMKDEWTTTEILNFGEMLLYFAFKQCILERPTIIYADDVRKRLPTKVFEPKKYFIKSNYELNGILDYFLDL